MKHEPAPVLTVNNKKIVRRNSSNNNSSSAILDEYQYFAPGDPNNPNNQPVPQTQLDQPDPNDSLTTSLNVNFNQQPTSLQQQAQHMQALQLQPEVTLTSLNALQKPAVSTPLSRPTCQTMPSNAPVQVLSCSRSCSSSPSIYVKDEPRSPNRVEIEDPGNGPQATKKLATIRPQTKQQLKARLLPITKHSSLYATSPPNLIINSNNELIDADAGDLDEELDAFDEDDDATRHCSPTVDVDMMSPDGCLSPDSSYIEDSRPLNPSQSHSFRSPREQLYIKFGDFLSARLNTLHETVANELMNKILVLIAEK